MAKVIITITYGGHTDRIEDSVNENELYTAGSGIEIKDRVISVDIPNGNNTEY